MLFFAQTAQNGKFFASKLHKMENFYPSKLHKMEIFLSLTDYYSLRSVNRQQTMDYNGFFFEKLRLYNCLYLSYNHKLFVLLVQN